MKNKSWDIVNFILATILLAVAAFAATKANASGSKKAPQQEQQQWQHQWQEQDQTQANEQTVNFSSHKRASSAIAPSTYAANDCVIPVSGSVSVPTFSIGGSKYYRDPNCEKLNTAMAFNSMGYYELGLQMACATDAAIEVLGDNCSKTERDAVKVLQARVEELKQQNTTLLDERVYDRQQYDALREKCSGDLEKMEESCTK